MFLAISFCFLPTTFRPLFYKCPPLATGPGIPPGGMERSKTKR
jgi:hypothetical protein